MATIIRSSYETFLDRFSEITGRAANRFRHRDWRGMQADATERLDAYSNAVTEAVEAIAELLGDEGSRTDWSAARSAYAAAVRERSEAELATTFFNSVTRRVFQTVGVDEEIEFLDPIAVSSEANPRLAQFTGTASVDELIDEMLVGADLGPPWHNLHRDVQLAADEVERHVEMLGSGRVVTGGELLKSVFYRGQGAYLVGRIHTDHESHAVCFAIHHTTRGLVLGAVLMEPADISVLFSYTRSSFHVETDRPAELIGYLREVMPHKKVSELYTILGHHKHGKTELYRDFMGYYSAGDAKFEHARGARGLVMIVFTMPGYDVVFKIIRDRFPFPKQTTRRRIMANYRLVFRHDRGGRLIDAQEFEHLRFDRHRFADALLEELQQEATKSVTITDQHVTLHHVYVERRVIPLDVYVREANPVKAQAAIVDYGRAIKNLASSNIFPGDMLLKNFGVTKNGRVVFYDYDELMLLTDCNFRKLPDSEDPNDEMSADPWFGVGDNDIFPEEFVRFMGIRQELRQAFEYAHGDIFGTRFWKRTQDRISGGEVIEIFPYHRDRRLGSNLRRRKTSVS